MGNVLVQESSLHAIADAIRLKNGSQTLYKPAEMSDAIEAISGGGITPSGTKSITANGTGIDVTSYAYADVAVPNTYAAGDEGKVVSSGALVSQTSDTVTANNTYDTTLINSLTVNVSGGGSGYASGDFTPSEAISTKVIETGLSTVHGILIYPSVTPYNVVSKRVIHTYIGYLDSSSYVQALCCCSNTGGTAKDTFTIWTSSTNISASGGTVTITIAYPDNTGWFAPIKYLWVAW